MIGPYDRDEEEADVLKGKVGLWVPDFARRMPIHPQAEVPNGLGEHHVADDARRRSDDRLSPHVTHHVHVPSGRGFLPLSLGIVETEGTDGSVPRTADAGVGLPPQSPPHAGRTPGRRGRVDES
jgi:hypothetical protein